MKNSNRFLLAAVAFVAMLVEWQVAKYWGAVSAIHNYHGICNAGVGRPYEDLVHQLRTIAESGDTNRLVTVLRRADERSRDIYDVWLGDGLPSYHDKYRKSVDEILR